MNTKLFTISIFILALMYGSGSYSDTSIKNEALAKSFIDSWDKHDINKLISLFSENCLYEVVADGGKFYSRQEIARYANSTFTGIPDTRMSIVKIVADDSTGAVEWVWKGTNTVGWPNFGIPPTNKYFELRGISIMEIENGLIKKNRDYWDWNTFKKGVSNSE